MDKKAASADPPAEVGEGGGGGGGAGGDPAQDPRNVAELTHYIQSMLQQMQDRWLTHILVLGIPYSFKTLDKIVSRFQTMSDQIITRIDDMSAR